MSGITEQDLVDDPGYPGIDQAFFEERVFFAPMRRLEARDLDRFWLIEYRWPAGLTPLGFSFADAGLTWGLQYAARHAPLPPTNGFDMRFSGTALYGTELPLDGAFERNNRAFLLDQAMPRFVDGFERLWADEAAAILAAARRMETVSTEGRSLAELGRTLLDANDYCRFVWERHFTLMYRLLVVQSGFYAVTDRLGIPRSDVAAMCGGRPSKVDELDEALWAETRAAREAGIAARLTGAPGAGALADLERQGGAAARWVAGFRGFLDTWGWRTETAADVACAPWIEDPAPALGHIAANLASGDDVDFAARRRAAAEAREAAIDAARTRLSAADRRVFEGALAANLKAPFVWWNEDHNFYIDQRSAIPMRRAALAIGRALDLAEPADTLFLFLPELRDVAFGRRRWRDLAGLVGERRAYFESWKARRKDLPKFVGRPPEAFLDPIMTELDGLTADFLARLRQPPRDQLVGVPAAAGRARGRARVMHDAGALHTVAAGEVLVCEGTSPSWTPAFGRIAACLTDQGGVLSHAATVAREYGVPCIVALGVATLRLKTGDLVEVDGAAGTVTVLAG